jgi:hypothetical protein
MGCRIEQKFNLFLFIRGLSCPNSFQTYLTQNCLNPLPCGTLVTFFLTAVGPIQHTNEDDIGRENTILMTSLRLERAVAVKRRQVSITPLRPTCRGQCEQSHVMT